MRIKLAFKWTTWLAAVVMLSSLVANPAAAKNEPGCLPECGGANLAGANLKGANLRGADLTGADLTNAFLTNAILTGVTWANTTCPDGSVTNTGC